jgi:hypothetical protein
MEEQGNMGRGPEGRGDMGKGSCGPGHMGQGLGGLRRQGDGDRWTGGTWGQELADQGDMETGPADGGGA